MPCPQLPKLDMGVNCHCNLDMGPAMGHLRLRNPHPIPLLMGRLNSHLVPLEVIASLLLSSQDIFILNPHLLAIVNQILVLSVPLHQAMVQQHYSQGMVLHLTVHHQLINQVMGRGHLLITLLMVVVIHSLHPIPLMAMQLMVLVGLIHHLHHSLLNKAVLLRHHHKVDSV